MMASKKQNRNKAQIAKHREIIASLYLKRYSQQEIADHLGINQATVSRDLAVLQAEWKQAALHSLDEAKAKELAKIDELEREYWLEWRASKVEKQSTLTEQVDGGKGGRRKAQIRKEERLGNAAYLTGVQWCIDKRCKLLGLDAPDRLDAVVKTAIEYVNDWRDGTDSDN